MYSINLSEILGSDHVSLAEMLCARENRVLEQQKILSVYNLPVISFTLNITGSIKIFPLAEKSFIEGKNLIKRQLERHHHNIVYEKERIDKTGYEAFFAVDFNPYSLKKLMVEIENSSPIGRIFDIDVLKVDGDKVSRQDINCINRTCLICREQAHVCARSKNHPI